MTAGALFRADAGPTIGLGHLQRCLSLAAALAEIGWRCSFLTNRNSVAAEYLAAHGFPRHGFTDAASGTAQDAEQTRAACRARGCSVVVVDSYAVDGEYLRSLRRDGLFVIAVDDLAGFSFPCQMVVNAGAHAPDLRYASETGDTRFLLGAQFAMLRPEFWKPALRQKSPTVRSVLVTLGGSELADAARLIELLDASAGDFSVTVVVGPLVANADAIRRAARKARRRVTIASAPSSMRDLMQASDACISGGGQTVYELCCVGTPVIAMQLAENQALSLAALERAGVILSIRNQAPEKALSDAVAALSNLAGDPGLRQTMRERGQRLVDGQGARRVAAAVAENNPQPVRALD